MQKPQNLAKRLKDSRGELDGSFVNWFSLVTLTEAEPSHFQRYGRPATPIPVGVKQTVQR